MYGRTNKVICKVCYAPKFWNGVDMIVSVVQPNEHEAAPQVRHSALDVHGERNQVGDNAVFDLIIHKDRMQDYTQLICLHSANNF